MPWWRTPARRRGVELLDGPGVPDAVRARAMADVARSNRWFGGVRAAASAVLRALPRTGNALLLDVGTGTADIPAAIAARARRRPGLALRIVGLDLAATLLPAARRTLDGAVAGDAARLPLADASADVVVCSQLLHHFSDEDAVQVLGELHRVARRAVVLCDLRRSRLAARLFGIAGALLRFHPVTRHDGAVSVMRGFTADELRALVRVATGVTPRVERSAFWRLTATWERSPAGASARYT